MTTLQNTREKRAAPLPDARYPFSKASEMDKTTRTLNLASIYSFKVSQIDELMHAVN